ncbi:MAG: hypothetical protein GY953_57785 [bacterium]|nr:hypothetical protein [bacterium]
MKTISHQRTLNKIGEGGMGVVDKSAARSSLGDYLWDAGEYELYFEERKKHPEYTRRLE